MTRPAKAMSAFNFGRSAQSAGRDARSFAGRGGALSVDGSGAPSAGRLLSFSFVVLLSTFLYLAFVPSAQAAPVASTGSTAPGAAPHLRVLQGTVNPNGAAVTQCRFAYGLTTDYGASVPCAQTSGEIGTGSEDVAVSAQTGPLEPASLYHYRLITVGSGQTVSGKDRTFTTAPAPADSCPNAARRAEQGIEVLLLPACMALEQVSPPVKLNQWARPVSVSASGGRVHFSAQAALGDEIPNNQGLGGDPYVATRGGAGWVTSPVNPPAPYWYYDANELSFSPDLSHWFIMAARTQAQVAWGTRQFFSRGLDGSLSPVTPLLTALSSGGSPLTDIDPLRGASADRSRLYFASVGGAAYLPGDPNPSGSGSERNVYVAQPDGAGNPSLELLARDGDGKVWGGSCGGDLGGMHAQNGQRNQGAVSADGSRVYFSTRPDQPEEGACLAASRKRIMERLETQSGPEISELIESECDRQAPDPPCATHDGDDFYQGASVDQSLVYFTTSRQLADTDLDGSATSCAHNSNQAGCDLYLLDRSREEGEQLIQVSAGDATAASKGSGANVRNSITAISGDGSHVYFVAQSVLTTKPSPEGAQAQPSQNNLYLYKHPEGEYEFIGAVANSDAGTAQTKLFGGFKNWRNGAYAVPIKGTDAQGNEIGGAGDVLLFRSEAPLTADDTDGTASDLFRYDANGHSLERVTKAAPGGADNGPFSIAQTGAYGGGCNRCGTDYAEMARWVSEDGETVVFRTAEAFVPGDTNGETDIYLWRAGQLVRLPGSAESGAPTLSHDGSTVAYTSTQQLLPSDGDTINDAYVARVNGGFAPPPPDPACEGEGCLGARAGLPGAAGAGSAALIGAGNLSARADCGAAARQAQRLAQRARGLRSRAKQAAGSPRAKRLRRQAARLTKRAQALRTQAKRCRANNNRRAAE